MIFLLSLGNALQRECKVHTVVSKWLSNYLSRSLCVCVFVYVASFFSVASIISAAQFVSELLRLYYCTPIAAFHFVPHFRFLSPLFFPREARVCSSLSTAMCTAIVFALREK